MAIKSGASPGAWKKTIVEHAAHSGTDPGMTAVLQEALADLAAEGAPSLGQQVNFM